jgi:hypothetical protein
MSFLNIEFKLSQYLACSQGESEKGSPDAFSFRQPTKPSSITNDSSRISQTPLRLYEQSKEAG